MPQLLLIVALVAVVAFGLGWLRGYVRCLHAHNWYLSNHEP